MDADAAGEQLGVTASPSTHVLHVTVRADTPSDAADAANAAVAAFVDVRRDALGSLRSEQLLQLRLMITEHEDELAKQQAQRLVVPSHRRAVRPDPGAPHQPGRARGRPPAARRRGSPGRPTQARRLRQHRGPRGLGRHARPARGLPDRRRAATASGSSGHRSHTTDADRHTSGSAPEFATPPRGVRPCQLSPPHPSTVTRVDRPGRAAPPRLVVIACIALGAFAGWYYARSSPATYTSTDQRPGEPRRREPVRAHALLGASGRADQSGDRGPGGPLGGGARRGRRGAPGLGPDDTSCSSGLRSLVPPNTQILEISYSATDPVDGPGRSPTRWRPPTSPTARSATTR